MAKNSPALAIGAAGVLGAGLYAWSVGLNKPEVWKGALATGAASALGLGGLSMVKKDVDVGYAPGIAVAAAFLGYTIADQNREQNQQMAIAALQDSPAIAAGRQVDALRERAADIISPEAAGLVQVGNLW